jgi:hypothetical protein
MDMLYSLAPYKAHGPDRFARVLDNWGLHERAKAGGASENLFQQHAASLKSDWQVFSRHRQHFVSVFEDVGEGTGIVPILTWETGPGDTRRWRESVDVVPLMRNLGTPVSDTLLGLVAAAYLQPGLARRWPAWKPLVRGGKSNYIGPASVPMMALLHKRSILNSRLVRAIEALDFA